MSTQDAALLEILRLLDRRGYRFVTPTNDTIRRVIRRPSRWWASGLRDIFGWNRPFARRQIEPELFDLLQAAGALSSTPGGHRCRFRVSSVCDGLYWHSGFPSEATSVFLGPDSYRFARFIEGEMAGRSPPATILDIGAGAGVGGLTAARLAPGCALSLTDVNPEALRLAAVNAAFAGAPCDLRQGEGLAGAVGPFDLILANPPYLGTGGRTYSDGGDALGAQLSLDWTREAAPRLARGGRLLLYTASAIVGGEDRLQAALSSIAEAAGCTLRYGEIDPDVFGGVLNHPAYWSVERLAAVGAVLERPRCAAA